jgi:hypothetical protein
MRESVRLFEASNDAHRAHTAPSLMIALLRVTTGHEARKPAITSPSLASATQSFVATMTALGAARSRTWLASQVVTSTSLITLAHCQCAGRCQEWSTDAEQDGYC